MSKFKCTMNLWVQHNKYRLFERFYSSEVRVRFAPSPTGFLHLGGLRTALYNYLYAKKRGGTFLLRIEDTDQTRIVNEAAKSIIEDLKWVGIHIDEGPYEHEGPYGPYKQSERIELYLNHVQSLLQNGSAYYCFCSEKRLELIRKEALRLRQIPKYDNKCRYLTKQRVTELLSKNTPYCIRFKLTDYAEPLHDLINGDVYHNVSENEGDPIIIKSDKFPTYHFANVVDDHLMNITHVFRGIEWQISTTKHLLMYKAFNWKAPHYGHLPLLINADGTKLSKRQGDIAIKKFREKGYFPNSVLNYIISAGGGFPHELFSKPRIHTLSDMIEKFDITKVNSSPSRLNPNVLDHLNHLELESMLQNDYTTTVLVNKVKNLIKTAYPNEVNLDLSPEHIKNILQWSLKRLTFIETLTLPQFSYLWIKPNVSDFKTINQEQFGELIALLESSGEFKRDNVKRILKDYAQRNNIKFPTLMKSLRGALCGLDQGPGVAEIMEVLGKQVVLQRLQMAAPTSSA